MQNDILKPVPSERSASTPAPVKPVASTSARASTPITGNEAARGNYQSKRFFFNSNRLGRIGLRRWGQLNRPERLASLMVCGLLLIIGTLGALELLFKDPPPPAAPVVVAKPPAPTTARSPLTGLEVPIELANLPITGVMIENSPDGRPQSGLGEAGVVFEAITEGGITRFLALYQEAMPGHIGPVRSVRPYYLDWLLSFDAAIAHAGGSGPALAQIRSQRIKDIDHGANPATFQRVNNRFAPHNLYTSREKLLAAHQARGYTTSDFRGFERAKRERPAEVPTAVTIALNISSPLYNSVFTYDRASNSYVRAMAGRPHIDAGTGRQINPKVVIALITDRSQSGIHSVYRTTGSGVALIFQDGGVIQASWRKADTASELSFHDPTGKKVAINPGQIWITVLTSAEQAVYGP